MIDRTVTVVPEAGLHARPATKFVEAVRDHDAEVNVGRPDEDLVSAGSMLAVTGLGVGHGEEVRITTDGPDEEAAMDALVEILTTPEEGEEDGAESEAASDAEESETTSDADDGEGDDSEASEATDESGEAD